MKYHYFLREKEYLTAEELAMGELVDGHELVRGEEIPSPYPPTQDLLANQKLTRDADKKLTAFDRRNAILEKAVRSGKLRGSIKGRMVFVDEDEATVKEYIRSIK
jgi:hypothetical protein